MDATSSTGGPAFGAGTFRSIRGEVAVTAGLATATVIPTANAIAASNATPMWTVFTITDYLHRARAAYRHLAPLV
ncbi:MAG: hypothetical protein ACRDTD_01045 [Pseudonocardiaceae bacterium]